MKPSSVLLTVSAALLHCAAANAASPVFYIRDGGWMCPAFGTLVGISDDQKQKRYNCTPVILSPTPVVLVDFDAGFSYACTIVRGLVVEPRESLLCGYVLGQDIVDDKGRRVPRETLERAPRVSSVLDAHKLP